jgi:aldose sugar dehydrogenase
MRLKIIALALFTSILAGAADKAAPVTFTSEGQKIKFETLLSDQGVIWGFDFLPENQIIFTLRSGGIKIYDQKSKSLKDVTGGPQVWAHGQGGLLDVRVHPRSPSKVYLCYSKPFEKGAVTAMGVGTLKDNVMTEFKDIFVGNDDGDSPIQFGCRIEFDNKGFLFLSIGDHNDRDRCQKLEFHNGKVIRIAEDGKVPADNPFTKVKGAKPEIWSLGLRNPQGLVMDPKTGDLWSSDFGPMGGDELNLIKSGANYGWPVITYGREYSGPKIGEGTSKPGMEQPIAYWVPSISPSGITVYQGEAFPKWKGNIFLGALSGMQVRRVALDNHKVLNQEVLLKEQGERYRNIRVSPEGFIYLSTDGGTLGRLVPNL